VIELKMLKKRVRPSLAILLVVVLLLLIFPLYNNYTTVFAENDCGYTGYLPPYTDPCSTNGYQFNETIWEDLELKVYGSWQAKTKNDFKKGTILQETNEHGQKGDYIEGRGSYIGDVGFKRDLKGSGEYRFHGFDVNGVPYVNPAFLPDEQTISDRSRLKWIYRPWDQPIDTKYSFRHNIAKFNDGNNNIQGIDYLDENLGFTISNGIDYKAQQKSYNYDVHEYMYVYHMPDLRTFGAGTMWHQRLDNGEVWHETFHMPKVGNRLHVPIDVTIDVLDPEPVSMKNYLGQSQIPVKVKVTGILQDQYYFGDVAGEFSYYTRKDIDEWTLNIEGKSKRSSQ
jgi:hypothetical protein